MDEKKPVIIIVGSDIHLSQQIHSRLHRQEIIEPTIVHLDTTSKTDEELSKILENNKSYLDRLLYGTDTDKLKKNLECTEINHSSLLAFKQEQVSRIQRLGKKLGKRWKNRKG